jgi:hypothetical protein
MARKPSLKSAIQKMLRRAKGPLGEGGAEVFVTFLVAACIVGAIAYTWKTWGHLVAGSSRYHVTEDSVEIPESPSWISQTTNVKKEVFDDGLLNETSALDPHAATKIAQAFELNPWVKKVDRVTKSAPNRVKVELEFRRPIAVVWIQVSDETGGWEPIDGEGVVLPEDLFHEDRSRIEQYLRIVARHSPSVPKDVGIAWPDERIQQAAALSAVLEHLWKDWGIDNVYVTRSLTDETPIFSLRMGRQTKVVWGRGLGNEVGAELTAMQKLALIGEYLKQHGTVDKWSEERVLDVQHPGVLRVTGTSPRR